MYVRGVIRAIPLGGVLVSTGGLKQRVQVGGPSPR
jgi:hypothetical protein